MAADTLPFPTRIAYPSSGADSYKTLESQYGNGVKQVAGDGLNNVQRKWSIVWAKMSLAQYQTTMEALRAAGGYQYFLWTPYGDYQGKWLIKDPQYKFDGPNVCGISATAEEFFSYP